MAKKSTASKFMQPMQLSSELQEVVGKGPMPRTEVTKKLWAYIKKNRCQDPVNKRNIIPDEKLAKIFGGKKAQNRQNACKEKVPDRCSFKHLEKITRARAYYYPYEKIPDSRTRNNAREKVPDSRACVFP